jgi:hypothetical protein
MIYSASHRRINARSWHLFTVALLLAFFSTKARAATGTVLPNGTHYPRIIRIQHGTPSTQGHILAQTNGKLFISRDDGKSFTFLIDIPLRAGTKLLCCEALYEVPQTVGSLAAGTLIYSPSVQVAGAPAIEIYTSTDEGATWAYHSTPVAGKGEKGKGGLWEPEFSVAKDGALVMFWSDETYSCCSQKLSKIRTTDGISWKDSSDAVATTTEADRPGMIIVSHLPTGEYFMSYEICGDPDTGPKCAAYYRTSRDGWNYGRPSNPGKRIETADGQFFEHAPANIWSPSPLSPNGVIVVVGQVLHNADKSVATQNGRVLFVNPLLDGSGPWTKFIAPVEVPNSYDNFCPNYSSALLPTQDGASLIELASDYDAPKHCAMYFAIKPWSALQIAAPPPVR